MKDLANNKIQNIQRYVGRAREIYNADPERFDTDSMRQDAALFNVLQGCEHTIDLANHVIRTHKLGMPPTSAESFDLVRQKSVIEGTLSEKL